MWERRVAKKAGEASGEAVGGRSVGEDSVGEGSAGGGSVGEGSVVEASGGGAFGALSTVPAVEGRVLRFDGELVKLRIQPSTPSHATLACTTPAGEAKDPTQQPLPCNARLYRPCHLCRALCRPSVGAPLWQVHAVPRPADVWLTAFSISVVALRLQPGTCTDPSASPRRIPALLYLASALTRGSDGSPPSQPSTPPEDYRRSVLLFNTWPDRHA